MTMHVMAGQQPMWRYERMINGSPRAGSFLVVFPVADMPEARAFFEKLPGSRWWKDARGFDIKATPETAAAIKKIGDLYEFSISSVAIWYLEGLLNGEQT